MEGSSQILTHPMYLKPSGRRYDIKGRRCNCSLGNLGQYPQAAPIYSLNDNTIEAKKI